MKKSITLLAIVTGAQLLVSCGNEIDVKSTSSAAPDKNENSAATYKDLPNCTSRVEGEVWYVEDEDFDYKCVDHVWVNLNSNSELDAKQDKTSSSSSSKSAKKSSSSVASVADVELPPCSPTDDFDESKYYCEDGLLYNKCGNGIYDPRKKFCDTQTNLTHDLCGGQSYNVNTKFCLEGAIENKCDGETYTSDQFCYREKLILDKCDGKEYDLSEKYCYAGAIAVKAEKITDSRDDIEYGTVTIGSQTWMAENLNYAAEGSKCYNGEGPYCNLYGRLYPWNVAMNLPSSCTKSNCEDQIKTKHKGVCPTGWHIPSQAEWTTLVNFVESQDEVPDNVAQWLKSGYGWEKGAGVDGVGFSALPAGTASETYTKLYGNLGTMASFWSATENDLLYGVDCGCTAPPEEEYACAFCTESKETGAFALRLDEDGYVITETSVPDPWNGDVHGVTSRSIYEKEFYMSVRCIKD